MFDLSPEKIFVLGMLALMVLGPNRLPGAARTLGRLLGQARSMSSSLQTEVREALHDPNDVVTSAIAEFRPAAVRRSVRRAVTDTLTGAPYEAAAPPSATPAAPRQEQEGRGTWPPAPDDPSVN